MEQKMLKEWQDIARLLEQHDAQHVFVVCGKALMGQPLQKYIDGLPVAKTYFSGYQPNPEIDDAVAGTRLFNDTGSDFLIVIGGGSAIDTAKAIKMARHMDLDGDVLTQPYVDDGLPFLAIPSTAGSGSEATHNGVLYHNHVKKAISNDAFRPTYVLLEPALLMTLPDYQRKVTMMDALCQAIESYWSVSANAQSKQYARQAMTIIMAHGSDYAAGKHEADAAIMQASYLSGQAINITRTTAAHAMSYGLVMTFPIAHGQAVAMTLPYLWQDIKKRVDSAADKRGVDYLRQTMADLDEILGGDGLTAFATLYQKLDLPKQHADEKMIEALAATVDTGRLGNSPVPTGPQQIRGALRSALD